MRARVGHICPKTIHLFTHILQSCIQLPYMAIWATHYPQTSYFHNIVVLLLQYILQLTVYNPHCVFPNRQNNQSFHLSLARGSSLWSPWSPLHCESQRQPWVQGEPQVRGYLRSSGSTHLSQSCFRAHGLTTALPVCRHVNNLQCTSGRLLTLTVVVFHGRVFHYVAVHEIEPTADQSPAEGQLSLEVHTSDCGALIFETLW